MTVCLTVIQTKPSEWCVIPSERSESRDLHHEGGRVTRQHSNQRGTCRGSV
jgi:hypothetical protein